MKPSVRHTNTAPGPTPALREANQIGSLQPTILVTYTADLGPVIDTRDQNGLERYGMTAAMLGDPAWRRKMQRGRSVPTQELARTPVADRFARLLIQSFAEGASSLDIDIVLRTWTGQSGSLGIVDDEQRLSGM